MQDLYLAALVTLVILAVVATLDPNFDDNFAQRAGLGLVGVGSAVEAMNLLQFSWSPSHAHMVFTLGCAVYGVGAVFKVWNRRRKTK
ncbi:hypothetical protein H4CHR_03000 [Variovorax sp. PBS-H4]|uniref:hypothetical protein n=1 Tax=Variovorax sp. PBS-H4 TaxID=434008 RepID=UPI001317E402|nr:hypothetical protein [Variovorax sp. PBS-H4]VTU32381.1 hypothetical protein H4CHR_03000 [Variovorax sp. PBS-H4]